MERTGQYIRLRQDGSKVSQQIVLTEHIRHKIHHPENDQNVLFTADELTESIEAMRLFLQA
jgi:hypothetical protein